jgi:hypothetical protein
MCSPGHALAGALEALGLPRHAAHDVLAETLATAALLLVLRNRLELKKTLRSLRGPAPPALRRFRRRLV